MITPHRAFCNPSFQNIDFIGGKRLMFKWHPLFGIPVLNPFDQFTMIGISRNDGKLTGLCFCQGLRPEQNTEAALPANAAVAGNALLIKNGLDLSIEINGLSSC